MTTVVHVVVRAPRRRVVGVRLAHGRRTRSALSVLRPISLVAMAHLSPLPFAQDAFSAAAGTAAASRRTHSPISKSRGSIKPMKLDTTGPSGPKKGGGPGL